MKKGLIFQPIKNILQVATKIAIDVAGYIFDQGLARVERPADMESFIKDKMYKPEYR
jgi:malate dehydrogenase (oxaloacetate-decarboxylating)(NADP+)